MPVLNPEHLFEQAERLAAAPLAGAPRQADIRRAISAAYYGVFHAVLTQAADQLIGKTKRSKSQYGLVYRSVDHRWLRELCDDAKKPTPPAKYAPHLPPNGLGPDIAAFAAAIAELQEKRHAADYDPMIKIKAADAFVAVRTARAALRRLAVASSTRRQAFLSLLIFRPR